MAKASKGEPVFDKCVQDACQEAGAIRKKCVPSLHGSETFLESIKGCIDVILSVLIMIHAVITTTLPTGTVYECNDAATWQSYLINDMRGTRLVVINWWLRRIWQSFAVNKSSASCSGQEVFAVWAFEKRLENFVALLKIFNGPLTITNTTSPGSSSKRSGVKLPYPVQRPTFARLHNPAARLGGIVTWYNNTLSDPNCPNQSKVIDGI